MSGFVAVHDTSGRAVPTPLLEGLARHLAWRGPDGSGFWHDGAIGLVQTQFRTTEDSETNAEPVRVAGVVIVGDIRLDNRTALITRLTSTDYPLSTKTSDLTLVLHAYLRDGAACLDHLAGDFAFVLWDSRQRQWFAARDQMGVVPLYWSQTETTLILGNSLHGLLAHPAVDDAIDQEMIADQLAIGMRIAADRTFYRNIRRLPQGHCLTATSDGVRVGSYWTLPERPPHPLRRKPQEYLEEFRDLFTQAVNDRWRGACAATHLSGGMDASSIAVWLAHLMGPNAPALKGYTHMASALYPDPEGPLAELVARRAGISWEPVPIEPIMLGEAANPLPIAAPEPVMPPQLWIRGVIDQRAATHARVLFSGYGGDPLFVSAFEPPFRDSAIATAGYGLRDIAFCAVSEPGLWQLWRNRPSRGAGSRERRVITDSLLNPDFVAHFGIEERRSARRSQRPPPSIEGMATHPLWRARMTDADPDFTGVPLRHRFPFFDLRLVRFMSVLPTRPWRTRKILLRLGVGRLLPPEIRCRRKTGVRTDLFGAFLRAYGPQPWMYELLNSQGNEDYFDKTAVIQCLEDHAAQDKSTLQRITFVFAVAHWLQHRPRTKVSSCRAIEFTG